MGNLLSRHYIRYIIIVVHEKSCARACVTGGYTDDPPSSLRGSSSSSSSSSFSATTSSPYHPPFVSFYHSRCPPHSSAAPRVSFARAGLPSWTFPVSCATVNHSACDCVRLITVIRLLLVPVYRPLIIIIDFSPTSLPCFHASYARMYRPNGSPSSPRRAADHGKACHSVAYTRDLSVCCAGSEICCETMRRNDASSITRSRTVVIIHSERCICKVTNNVTSIYLLQIFFIIPSIARHLLRAT